LPAEDHGPAGEVEVAVDHAVADQLAGPRPDVPLDVGLAPETDLAAVPLEVSVDGAVDENRPSDRAHRLQDGAGDLHGAPGDEDVSRDGPGDPHHGRPDEQVA